MFIADLNVARNKDHASGNLTPGSTLYENGGLVGDMM